ncbi:MAG: CHAD domain-containing protein, partial [Actinomycetota bacterium]
HRRLEVVERTNVLAHAAEPSACEGRRRGPARNPPARHNGRSPLRADPCEPASLAAGILRLVREGIGEETFRRENARFRAAGRALAGSRDAEAKVETLDALAERFGDHLPASFNALRECLEEERDALVSAQGNDDSKTRRLAALAAVEIAAGRAAVEHWSPAKSGWKLLAPGLKRSYKRGRDRFGDVLGDPSPENVHEWRKRVKDLWYHLRLLRDSWPEVLGVVTDQAHELSDLLGDHHDLSVLAQDLENRHNLAGGSEESAAIAGLIEARQEELLEAAVPIGERLYADPPRVFVERLHADWRAWRPASQRRAAA